MVYQVDETREAILRRAAQIFTDRGFFDPQMKDIAEAAGISRSSLYRYYRDKTDLAMAVIERLVRGAMARIYPAAGALMGRRDITGLEKLERYLMMSWLSPELEGEMKFLAQFDAYFTGGRAFGGFRERITEIFGTGDDPFITAALEGGIADGSVRPDIDLHLAMATLVDSVRGLRQRLALRGELLIELRAGEEAMVPRELLRYLIGGLAAGGGRMRYEEGHRPGQSSDDT